MAMRRTGVLVLLCGILIFTATLSCRAQESVKLPEVKPSPTILSPLSVPEITNSAVTGPSQVKPDKKASERAWYWRFMEGIIMGTAKYNTDKQNDGRPQPPANSR